MKKELRYRLNGLEGIIHSLHHNAELMKYMSFNLHKEPFNLFNNIGLHWIWGQAMGNQIISFYKVMLKDEKFSFTKIINVAKELKCQADYGLLENGTKALKAEYDKTDFETVRSKYIAHQDLGVPEIRADILKIISLTEKSITLFLLFSKEFKGRKVNLSNHVVDSLNKIFGTIDEYEWVKAFLIAERIKGNDTVKISRIGQVIKEHQREVRQRTQKKKTAANTAPQRGVAVAPWRQVCDVHPIPGKVRQGRGGRSDPLRSWDKCGRSGPPHLCPEGAYPTRLRLGGATQTQTVGPLGTDRPANQLIACLLRTGNLHVFSR